MEAFFLFFKAWLIGIAIAAPVGPIGMLCIRKTMQIGLIGAISLGFGAAFADAIYGIIAATGLTTISHFMLEQANLIKMIGGVFLIYLAYREFKSNDDNTAKPISTSKNLLKFTLQVFFLTLTNPATILSFLGIFAGIGGGASNLGETLIMVGGIFVGSMSWWLILGLIIIKIKHKLPVSFMQNIRLVSVAILGGFGIFSLWQAF